MRLAENDTDMVHTSIAMHTIATNEAERAPQPLPPPRSSAASVVMRLGRESWLQIHDCTFNCGV